MFKLRFSALGVLGRLVASNCPHNCIESVPISSRFAGEVMNLSTPANYFHALRRQQHRDFRQELQTDIYVEPYTIQYLRSAVPGAAASHARITLPMSALPT